MAKNPFFEFPNIGILRQFEQFERLSNPMGKLIRQTEALGRLAGPSAFSNQLKLAHDISGLSAFASQRKFIEHVCRPFGGLTGFNALSERMKTIESIDRRFGGIGGINALSNQMKLAQKMTGVRTSSASMAQVNSISAAAAAINARGLLPNIGLNRITTAIEKVASTLLGKTINTVALAFPSQSFIASEALSALAGLKLQPEFAHDGTFVGSLATLQDAFDKSEDDADLPQLLLEAAQAIQRQLEELLRVSKSKFTTIATFITLVLSVLSFYYTRVQVQHAETQTHYAELAEERAQEQDETNKQLNDTLSKIADMLSQAQSAKQNSNVDTKCFRVDRAVYVRERKDTTSLRITLLQPGAIIEVDESSRYWAHVIIDDHITGVVRTGWVWKRNISRCR